MRVGGGLPTPYLAAGGVAAAAIVGIGLAGAKPDQASPQSSGSAAPKSSGSAASKSSGGGFCCSRSCFDGVLIQQLGHTAFLVHNSTPLFLDCDEKRGDAPLRQTVLDSRQGLFSTCGPRSYCCSRPFKIVCFSSMTVCSEHSCVARAFSSILPVCLLYNSMLPYCSTSHAVSRHRGMLKVMVAHCCFACCYYSCVLCTHTQMHSTLSTALSCLHLCSGSSGGMPEGKDPELDSATAKKKDPFFKEVAKRTK